MLALTPSRCGCPYQQSKFIFFLHIYNEVNCHRKIYFDCCNAHNAMKSKINDAEIDLKTNSQK